MTAAARRRRGDRGDPGQRREQAPVVMSFSMGQEPRVVGVDGCKAGWVAVVVTGETIVTAGVFADFAALLAAEPTAAVFAVDIPVGLPDAGVRKVDLLARELLRPRQSTLFPMPPRQVLAAATHAEAVALGHRLGVGGISAQGYALRDKIFDVERARDRARVVEVHPELCFRAMNGGAPLLTRKHSWTGFLERRTLLERHGLALPGALPGLERAGVDDVVDAVAAAWTARRVVRGEVAIVTDAGQPGIAIHA